MLLVAERTPEGDRAALRSGEASRRAERVVVPRIIGCYFLRPGTKVYGVLWGEGWYAPTKKISVLKKRVIFAPQAPLEESATTEASRRCSLTGILAGFKDGFGDGF